MKTKLQHLPNSSHLEEPDQLQDLHNQSVIYGRLSVPGKGKNKTGLHKYSANAIRLKV